MIYINISGQYTLKISKVVIRYMKYLNILMLYLMKKLLSYGIMSYKHRQTASFSE